MNERVRTGLLWGAGVGGLLALVAGGLVLAYRFGGLSLLIDAIVYLVLFGVTATFIPVLIFLKVPGVAEVTQKLFGRLHFVLGAVAYGVVFLVQQDAGWDLCRGRRIDPRPITVNGEDQTVRYEVQIDGEWRPVIGDANLSILGWRPFGILRDKTGETMRDVRVDETLRERKRAVLPDAAEIGSADLAELVDGGDPIVKEPVERGGITEVALTVSDVPHEGWLVDLKQLYARGIDRIGDIKLVEKAEEITMRNDAKSGTMANRPLLGSIVGLVLGIITGYIMLGGI